MDTFWNRIYNPIARFFRRVTMSGFIGLFTMIFWMIGISLYQLIGDYIPLPEINFPFDWESDNKAIVIPVFSWWYPLILMTSLHMFLRTNPSDLWDK